MSFNRNPNKQAQKMIVEKKMKSSCPSVYFNNFPVSPNIEPIYVGMLLDDKLSYEHYLNFVLYRVKKTVRLFLIISEKSSETGFNYNLQIFRSASCMIKPLMNHFTKILNLFNIT